MDHWRRSSSPAPLLKSNQLRGLAFSHQNRPRNRKQHRYILQRHSLVSREKSALTTAMKTNIESKLKHCGKHSAAIGCQLSTSKGGILHINLKLTKDCSPPTCRYTRGIWSLRAADEPWAEKPVTWQLEILSLHSLTYPSSRKQMLEIGHLKFSSATLSPFAISIRISIKELALGAAGHCALGQRLVRISSNTTKSLITAMEFG